MTSPLVPGAARAALLVALGALLCAGCPGTAPPRAPCGELPGCPEKPCCEAARRCHQEVCQGVGWVCRAVPEGGYRWLEDAPCSIDAGPLPDLGPRPDGSGDGGPGCTANACGAHAECLLGACACVQGYANSDGHWQNGCEEFDPRCSWSSCGFCPAGYCGAHAHCRDNLKCRCNDRAWKQTLDADGHFLGCLTPTTDCRWDNCNNCYTAFCGPHADCRKNQCTCIEAGFSDCNGTWEYEGCECAGSCVGGSCQ